MTPTEQAIALRAEARSHNKMSRWHRHQAQQQMAMLQRFCDENGIDIKVVEAPKQGQQK